MVGRDIKITELNEIEGTKLSPPFEGGESWFALFLAFTEFVNYLTCDRLVAFDTGGGMHICNNKIFDILNIC